MRKKLKELQNGCFRTEVYISPKNHNSLTDKSVLPKYWFVECRFFDPHFHDRHPSGFQYRKKFSGTNVQELKAAAKIFKDEMEYSLDTLNYNPISKEFMTDRSNGLHPGMLFVDALEKIFEKIKDRYKTTHHAKQVRCMVARIRKAKYISRLDSVRISEIRTYHIKNLLDVLNLTDNVYNKFRTYLMGLFKELVQYGCVDSNFIRDISKREISLTNRSVLTPEKFDAVFDHLKKEHYYFFRYAIIFHYSGARSSEMFRLKKSDVDLENLEFVVKVLKGRKESFETKAIIPAALPYWQEIMNECKSDDDHIFSVGQRPGKKEVSSRSITLQWKRKVKTSKDIKDNDDKIITVTEDFYSLKHLFLRKLSDISVEDLAPIINLAQGAASHKSARTTNIYTGKKTSAEVNLLKHVKIS